MRSSHPTHLRLNPSGFRLDGLLHSVYGSYPETKSKGQKMQKFLPCAAIECTRNAHRSAEGKLGYCSMHYQRFKRHGDPSIVKPIPMPALDWIESNKTLLNDDCLRWPFHIGKDGYGRAHHRNGPLTTASRLMCIAAHGEPPAAQYEAAHSCGKGSQGCEEGKFVNGFRGRGFHFLVGLSVLFNFVVDPERI